jgi:hypothetical protein
MLIFSFLCRIFCCCYFYLTFSVLSLVVLLFFVVVIVVGVYFFHARSPLNYSSPDVDDCHVIVNDKSTEFMLATVVEEAGK